jgi:hypothetical protein
MTYREINKRLAEGSTAEEIHDYLDEGMERLDDETGQRRGGLQRVPRIAQRDAAAGARAAYSGRYMA